MTDPLTGKELVQRSYDYLERLTRECAKALLEETNKNHRKFDLLNVHSEVATGVLRWFARRDKNVDLSFDGNSIIRSSPTQSHMKFKGNTKDADFALDCSIVVFVPPGVESTHANCFLKALSISADKASFVKRKF